MIDLPELTSILIGVEVRNAANEKDVQDRIAAKLDAHEVQHQREVPITGGRVDFLVGNIGIQQRVGRDILEVPTKVGIEVKVKGSLSALTRQVSAYMAEPSLDALIVVTTRRSHVNMPAEMGGKPLFVVWVGGGSL